MGARWGKTWEETEVKDLEELEKSSSFVVFGRQGGGFGV